MLNLIPVIVVVFIVASILKVSFMYYVFYLLTLVWVVGRLWNHFIPRTLTAERRYEPRAFLGETVPVELAIVNRSLIPIPWLRLRDRLPVALATPSSFERILTLLPNGKETFHLSIHCRQRGYYALGPVSVETGDVFGLGETTVDVLPEVFLTVYPRILDLDQLGLPSRSPFGDLRTNQILYQDPARVGGVRDYQVGDSLRSVHWRTSAAANRLQVKTYEPAMTLQTVIVLNLNVHEYERQSAYYAIELGIVVAASLASYLVGRRQEVGLLTNARDVRNRETLASLAPRKGHDHLMHILELLARADPIDGGRAITGMLREMAPRLPWGSTILVIVGREDDDLVDTLLALRRSGFQIVIVFVAVASRYREDTGRLVALGFKTYSVWREEDFNVWRRTDGAIAARA